MWQRTAGHQIPVREWGTPVQAVPCLKRILCRPPEGDDNAFGPHHPGEQGEEQPGPSYGQCAPSTILKSSQGSPEENTSNRQFWPLCDWTDKLDELLTYSNNMENEDLSSARGNNRLSLLGLLAKIK